MKKLLLALGLWLGLVASATAQCVAVGGVNSVPQVGVVCLSEPTVDTYAATGIGIVPAAAATDIACLTGSATRIVRLQAIRVSGTGTAITIPVVITKHAVANTGGTAATGADLPVPFALDSTDAAATATTTAYTANPTITAGAGVIDVQFLGLAATTTSTAGNLNFNHEGRNFSEPVTLRGVAQQVCVNLNGTTPTASLSVSFRWTEAPQ